MGSASGRVKADRPTETAGRAAAGRVREARVRAGMTQEQLASRLGVAFATVNRWENGRSGMSAAVRRRFAELLAGLDDEAARSPGRPPLPISSFVGREAEIATVTGLLAASRLASLVGPGGAGKTRLVPEGRCPRSRWPPLVARGGADNPRLVREALRRPPGGPPPAVFVALDRISDPA